MRFGRRKQGGNNMAKSKNKKDVKRKNSRSKAPPAAEAPKNSELKKAAPQTTARQVSSESSNLNNIKKEKQAVRTGVRLSTCLAGMFLCLCLGLYLGSLLPDMMAAAKKSSAHAPAQSKPLPAAKAEPNLPTKPAPALITEEKSSLAISPKLKQHIEHLEKDVTNNPQNAKLLADLGNAYFDTGQTGKAISAYEKSLAINPSNPDVLTDLGIMFREEKKYDQALDCFRKAAALNPAHLNALFNEGVVLGLDLHKHSEAKAAWTRLLQISPDARTPDGRKISDIIRQFDGGQPN